ncbi:hypothetical protein [Pseudovibrio sp. Tun.PSC04-5.I4]|uniref:hypothetical protein n=1 Tax=Pseudovibrio sp. Tun.PSC04-5.I4 TaxID=1798213 RepID=UPI00088BC588|nr:hypothetical protein [Pseudovibrio sp. Tun.PSC04-5.I4]SDQ90564.1 hypothetical protein SAMN04515695_1844 [Pseudovibrio sp. Tun.PSC04-5.I4]
MIGKFVKYVCVPLMVLGGASALTNSDFASYLSITSFAAERVHETLPSADDLRLSTELDYRGLHTYRPLLKYSADKDIIEVLKAKRTLTRKLMVATDPLVCAQEYSGATHLLPDKLKQVEAESNAEEQALLEMLAAARIRAAKDGVRVAFTGQTIEKKVTTSDSNPKSSFNADLYLPANDGFETLMKVCSMESLSRVFAADPTDEQLCDSEVRLFDEILALPAPHGAPMRRYFVDLIYFAGN